ncbi:hypothetical protein [Aporhodopirellula aestuarii]|uniref:Uncharacterized protein n=1 Tax=Aporhodopirellula aestuarii TaxID=2950107 RepID=A0ABT0UCU7_9BACT|nr:hypothetical protein [Aporhodopirellula aestuarii]MCM2374714.1 hypothetical protein [Aporhodopirellula aestuarii]
MDYGGLILTTCLVVALAAFLGWIGDWSGSRRNTENSRYWRSHDIHCPDCNRLFTPTGMESGNRTITPNQH